MKKIINLPSFPTFPTHLPHFPYGESIIKTIILLRLSTPPISYLLSLLISPPTPQLPPFLIHIISYAATPSSLLLASSFPSPPPPPLPPLSSFPHSPHLLRRHSLLSPPCFIYLPSCTTTPSPPFPSFPHLPPTSCAVTPSSSLIFPTPIPSFRIPHRLTPAHPPTS